MKYRNDVTIFFIDFSNVIFILSRIFYKILSITLSNALKSKGTCEWVYLIIKIEERKEKEMKR